jgi:hypothetical protein
MAGVPFHLDHINRVRGIGCGAWKDKNLNAIPYKPYVLNYFVIASFSIIK